MTEHLPECPKSADRYAMASCICDRLLACRARTLTDARDAVEALDPRYDGEWRIKYADALATIDALRGESHG